MAFDPARVKSLFLEASDLPSPEERAAYLDRECGGEPELRARVEALLAVDDRAGPIPEPEATGVFRTDPGRVPRGDRDVRVRKPFQGRGFRTRTPASRRSGPPASAGGTTRSPGSRRSPGSADSCRARSSPGGTRCSKSSARAAWAPSTGPSRSQPVKRQVALKLIKTGMDSRAVLARFDAERQALAMMDHPNIARVYDGGDHRRRPAVLRHGAGQRRADHRVLRPAPAAGRGPAGAVRARSARRCSTPTRRGSSTATSSRPT